MEKLKQFPAAQKRLVCILLALICMLGLLPSTAFAAGPNTIVMEDCTHNGVYYESAALSTCWLHQMKFDYNGDTVMGFCADHGGGMGWSLEGHEWNNPREITDPTVKTMLAYFYAHSRGIFTDQARALGVDIDSMLISQPDTGEQGLEICEALVRSGAIDVVVVDSVAALTPRAEIEGDMGDSHVGLLARLMSQALRKLAGSIAKTNCIVIFINQLREKVGVMYGNPEVTTGGRALKFYASVRIDVRRVEALKNGGEVIGNRTRAKIVKNKVSPPFREAEFDIMYGEGISKWGELVDLAVKLDILQKSGSWFSMGETRLGQGRDAVKEYLKNNPELADRIEAEVRANSFKLMSKQSQIAARAAGRAVDVSADDFEDGADGQ